MKKLKNIILSSTANCLSTTRLVHRTGTDLIFPFYHTVSDEFLPHIHPLYSPKTINEFLQDLDFLLKHFQPVDMETAFSHCKKERQLGKPSFHLSFDDGLREVYDIITPILYNKGVPFSVFLNSDFVNNRNLFFRHREVLLNQSIDPEKFLIEKQPYLSVAQLIEMKEKGVHIGAHSVSHPRYGEITENEQLSQTLDSCNFVKEIFNQDITTFAFPFSDNGISESFFESIYSSVDLTFGISGIYFHHNNRHIGRIDMEKYGRNAKECVNKALLVRKIKHEE